MMKFWSHFCFLVLAVFSLSRGQTDSPPDKDPTKMQENTSMPLNGTTLDISSPSVNTTVLSPADLSPTVLTTKETIQTTAETDNATAMEAASTATQTAASVRVPGGGKEGANGNTKPVPKTTATSPVIIEDKDSSSWGYVILVLIILVIIILCVILYILRRVSRTYSFDLQRPSPVNRPNEPIGTFEPVYLDDLAPKENMTTDDLSPPPVVNGTALPSEENGSNGDNALQEQPDANGSPTSNTSPSLGDDPADNTSSPLGSTNLLFDIIGEEQQNGNNNNPSVCSSDPFVEINLDEPAWCDQLLTAPEAPSSVLPFSPFSFSSSSSSSSS